MSSSPSSLAEFLLKSKLSLTPCINDLSNKIQKNYTQTTNGTIAGSNVILGIENEALEHIEYLILNLFYLLLTNSSQQQQQQAQSPQNPTILQSQSTLSSSSTSLTSLVSTISSSTSTISSSTTTGLLLNQHELNSLLEVETRVRRLLPKNLAETAIQRGNIILVKYQNLPKRWKDHLIRSTNITSSSTSIIQAGLNSLSSLATFTTSKPLPQAAAVDNTLLIYPVDKLGKLVKSLFHIKLDKHILVYLITVLEFLTKDILRISCGYVRNLNKQIITKRDVCVAISSDNMLVELFYGGSSSIGNETSDEDSLINNQLLNSLLNENPSGGVDNGNSTCGCLSLDKISFNSISSGDSDKTICNECQMNTNKRVNLYTKIYTVKVKEFQFELNQHINDLSLLRKLFRNYLLKCVNKFYSTTTVIKDEDLVKKLQLLSDVVFGNLNDLYECSLRLLDSLDDLIQSVDEQMLKLNDAATTFNKKTQLIPKIFVGQAFWELAEGAEFDVYEKYAKIQIENNFNYDNISKMIQILQSKSELYSYLSQKLTFNLNDTFKYLLPKLLLSPIYYILYLYDTIEYLINLTQCEEDKDFLKQTLDTLLKLKYYLNDKFISSKLIQTFYNSQGGLVVPMRPIEASIRILQYNYTNFDTYLNLIQTHPNLKDLFKKLYIFKLNSQTETKWSEIKRKSLKDENNEIIFINSSESVMSSLDTQGAAAASFKQTLSKRLNPYLYETSIFICKTNQQIPSLTLKHSSIREYLMVLNNAKYKLNERYIYLFDGLLMIFKQIYTQSAPSSSLAVNVSTSGGGGADVKLKLKHEISLAKCILIDRKDDDLCFELQLFFNSNQDCEYFLFICKSNIEKLHLMSLFCYIQYKLQLDRMLQNVIESLNHQNPLPIPPSNYLFNQPDIADNIIFDSNDAQASDGPIIKAAIIEKLIERLTHHLYLYPKFSRTFLMCYREFCSPVHLLDLLVERFNIPELNLDDIDDFNDDESTIATKIEIIKRYKREYQQPIQLKVINVIRHWIDGYFNDDFDKSEELTSKLNRFINNLGETNNRYQQVLLKSLEKKRQQMMVDINIEPHIDHNLLTLYPTIETHLEELHPYDILTIHPLEFARQATLMESELYKAIKPNELITLGWMKPNKYELAPNVTRLINLSNKFTYWYSKLIVDTLNLDERCAVIQRILEIANYFYELNNFSGLREIYGALEAASVYRLQVTREKCNIENHFIYEKFRLLFDNHSSVYLEELKKCNPPCVPFIGIHLTIILKTYEYNKLNADKQKQKIQELQLKQQQHNSTNNSSSSSSSPSLTPPPSPLLTTNNSQLINFAKYRLLVDFVTDLLQYQATTYKLHPHKRIQSFILEDIENYYHKATSEVVQQINESILSDDLVKQDHAQLIAGWLDSKSKLIEPEKNKFNNYPQLRKYNLKSPAPKFSKTKNNLQTMAIVLPKQEQNQNIRQQPSQSPQRVNNNQLSLNRHLSSSNSIRNQPPSPSIQQQQKQKPIIGHKNKFLTLDPSLISINTDIQSSSTPLSTPKLDKSSLSSADSSAPNSPPPNYDDVFQLTIPLQHSASPSPYTLNNNSNCYDNKTYFLRLSSNFEHKNRRSTTSSVSSDVQSPRTVNSSKKYPVNSSSNTFFFPSESILEQHHHHFRRHQHIQPPSQAPPPPPPPPPPPNELLATSSIISSSSSSIGAGVSTPLPPPLPARQRHLYNLT